MKMFTEGYQFEDYQRALEGAGPKLKELILERAAHDTALTLWSCGNWWTGRIQSRSKKRPIRC